VTGATYEEASTPGVAVEPLLNALGPAQARDQPPFGPAELILRLGSAKRFG
jgi:hypothetical protein